MSKRVFAFNYTLKATNGDVLDKSEANQPLPFLEGTSQILPALEKEILTMAEGDKKLIKLKPEEAYGPQSDKMIMDVEKKELSHIPDLNIGTFLQLNLQNQTKVVRVSKMTDTHITLDGNHPLAGQALEFDIELVLVRPATQIELAHGHVHGLHGHSHH
ncbi:MAG: FKBP-type peptidyl-prolyl cis-trans isomerase [Bdellovibrionaceae bacterium]|nr:FKBP-type peptidyl-prolyl cis-trans isomerase [Pseudobdellovibrionaceae bacterium]